MESMDEILKYYINVMLMYCLLLQIWHRLHSYDQGCQLGPMNSQPVANGFPAPPPSVAAGDAPSAMV